MSRLPLFVHGTWTTDGEDAPLLGPCVRRPASLRGELYALPTGRSVLVPGPTGEAHGELVEGLPERLLQVVDLVEGVPGGRVRREELDVIAGLTRIRAWVLVGGLALARTGRRLPDGRWRHTRTRGAR